MSDAFDIRPAARRRPALRCVLLTSGLLLGGCSLISRFDPPGETERCANILTAAAPQPVDITAQSAALDDTKDLNTFRVAVAGTTEGHRLGLECTFHYDYLAAIRWTETPDFLK